MAERVDEFNVTAIIDTNAAVNRVVEHSPAGTPVGFTAFADDADGTNSGITYSLWNTRGGRFAIDPATGVVTVGDGQFLDREVQASWSLTVLATSQDGSISVKEFTVELIDVDEYNVGQVFDTNSAANTIVENCPTGTLVGITGFAVDLDATTNAITYSLWNTRGGRFAINPTTGVVTVANGGLIDRERPPRGPLPSWPPARTARSAPRTSRSRCRTWMSTTRRVVRRREAVLRATLDQADLRTPSGGSSRRIRRPWSRSGGRRTSWRPSRGVGSRQDRVRRSRSSAECAAPRSSSTASTTRLIGIRLARILAAELGAPLVEIDGGGHSPIGRQPVIANRLIRDFVRSLDGPR